MDKSQINRMSVAVGALVRKDNRVLFVRQTYGILKGQWGLPTEFVDKGEFPEEAAIRETLEEASIYAEVIGLIAIFISLSGALLEEG
jgi:8-oxo-dGTP diphosphatase